MAQTWSKFPVTESLDGWPPLETDMSAKTNIGLVLT